MQLPIITEISEISAHRREVDLVRWSLITVPEARMSRRIIDVRDPLRRVEPASLAISVLPRPERPVQPE